MGDNYQKQVSPIDRWREASGLYKLGFDEESFKGLVLPIIAVLVVGGGLGLLIRFWL